MMQITEGAPHSRAGRSSLALLRLTLLRLTLLCAVTWPFAPLLAQAPATSPEPTQVLSNEQILQSLSPKPATRGLSLHTRGLARQQASESDQSVNLNIPFELNSAALKPQASVQLQQLQLALSSPALGLNRFVVAGHTDAKGSAEYNKQLSLRRAETVKQFLVQNGIDPKRLETVGYGADKLLSPDHPDDPSNRRVEIRAIAAAQ